MDVLKIAEKTSDRLWSNMTDRQRWNPEKINPVPEQWLADEVYTLLHDFRTNHYGAADNLQESREAIKYAKTHILSGEQKWDLKMHRCICNHYKRLINLEKKLQKMGFTGTNLNPRKYRVSYDRVFLAHPPFEYNGDLITGASLDLTFKCFKNGKEVLFGENEEVPGASKFQCSADKEHGYSMEHKPDRQSCFDSIICEATRFYLEYYEGRIRDLYEDWPEDSGDMPCSGCKPVSKEEFVKVIQDHWENFNNSNNRHAQNCAWCHEEVLATAD